MSQINTNGINTNYPVPGQNNSTQGFRDNFTQIKSQLNTGATEITDLQNKVVVKAALDNTTVNNDMANTVISNAATRGFRATTYNLGNALAGTVLVDVNRADFQYGAITGNVILQFGGWAPTNTESNVVLKLTVTDPNYSISLPSSRVSSNNNYGVTLLENYANVSSVATLTAPANANVVEYTFSTIDCGNTVTVSPINRPFQATQIVTRDVSPTGLPGDMAGAVAVSSGVNQLHITSTNSADYFSLASGNTGQLYLDMPVVFTGTSFEANITSGTTYYVRNVVSTSTFTVSSTVGGGNVNLAGGTGNMYANPASYLYVCNDSYDATVYSKSVSNTFSDGNIELNNITNLVVNAPIIFAGNVDYGNSKIVTGKVYYVQAINSPNVKVSMSRVNGVAGSVFVTGAATSLTATANVYVGSDIWKRVTLSNW